MGSARVETSSLGGKGRVALSVASAVDSARQADRAAAAKEAKDRDERERLRKEKLQKELDDAAEPAAEGGGGGAAKKKKKRKLGSGAELGLSFDAEEEG